MSNRVVQVGEGAPSLYDLDRLAECLNLASQSGGYMLLNDVSSRPGFEWTKGWLRHMVALPMWHEKRLLGVMLAPATRLARTLNEPGRSLAGVINAFVEKSEPVSSEQ